MSLFEHQLAPQLEDNLKPYLSTLQYHHTEYEHDGMRGELLIDVYAFPTIRTFIRVVQMDGLITRVERLPPKYKMSVLSRLQDKQQRLRRCPSPDENYTKQNLQKAYLTYMVQALTRYHTENIEEIYADEKKDLDLLNYKNLGDFTEILFLKADTFDKIMYVCLYCNTRFPHRAKKPS